MKYKRHARGGKFDKLNFGDLGLRAFQDQQKIIIDSLKLQQARSSEYGREYITSLKGTQQSEKENRRILQNLENEYYENRRSAVEKRGKREVEALLGRAKDYGKEAVFWADFAPKFAKNLGSIAETLTDHASYQHAMEVLDKNETQEHFNKYLQQLDEKQHVEGIELEEDALRRGDTESAKYIRNLLNSNNRFISEQAFARVLHMLPSMETRFADNFRKRNNGHNWEADDIAKAYLDEYKFLKQDLRLPNTKATQKLKDKFIQMGYLKQNEVKKSNSIKETEKTVGIAVERFGNERSYENLVGIYNSIREGIYEDVDVNDPSAVIQKTIELTASFFPSYNDQRDYILAGPEVGAVKNWVVPEEKEGESIGTRLGGISPKKDDKGEIEWVIEDKNGKRRSSNLLKNRFTTGDGPLNLARTEKQWQKGYADNTKTGAQKDADLLEANAIGAYNDLQRRIDSGKDENLVNIKNKQLTITKRVDSWNKLVTELNSYSKYNGIQGLTSDPAKLLRKQMGTLKPGTYLESNIEKNLARAIFEGDFNEAVNYYEQADNKTQDHYKDQMAELEGFISAIENSGSDTNTLNKMAISLVKGNSGLFESTQKIGTSGNNIIPDVRARIVALYKEESTDLSFRQRLKNVNIKLQNELKDQQATGSEIPTGQFASIGPGHTLYKELTKGKDPGGLTRIYLSGSRYDKNTHSITTSELFSDVTTVTPENLSTFFGDRAIISRQATDMLAYQADINAVGEPNFKSSVFANFQSIINNQPKGGTLTMVRLANAWLEHKGYKQRFPPGPQEKIVDHAVANGLPNPHKMRSNDLFRSAAYWDAINKDPKLIEMFINPSIQQNYQWRR